MKTIPVILLAFANERQVDTLYLRNLPKELAGIREGLQYAEIQKVCEVIYLSNATISQIIDVLQDERYRDRIAIFHYGGHADSFHLLLENIEGTTIQINGKNFLRILNRPSLKLAFLNGCSTQSQARSLIEAGVPLVIGTIHSISDEVATRLAIRFYKGIAQGIHIEQSWIEAMEEINAFYGNSMLCRSSATNYLNDKSDPWHLNIRRGSESIKFWSLVQAAGNPLFGLPSISNQYYTKLPAKPFLNLNHFEEKHAAIFFGRGLEIRSLYNKIRSPYPVILYYGQSGVGKSSLLHAGLIPRLSSSCKTKYLRRDASLGLVETIARIFSLDIKNEFFRKAISDRWIKEEKRLNKPLVIILDQAEEAFTRPLMNSSGEKELNDLCEILNYIFIQSEKKPKGKIIIAYRKEYHPEIMTLITKYEIPFTGLFLQALSHAGIKEVVEGLTKDEWLKDKYKLEILPSGKGELTSIIADDLIEDDKTVIAPVLQILLSKMWDNAIMKSIEYPQFDIESYQELKRKGILLSDFLKERLNELQNWNTEAVDSGLVLDLLNFHTTPDYTAGQHSLEEIEFNYNHCSDILKELLLELSNNYLLTPVRKRNDIQSKGFSLAHDILAPLIRKEFDESSKPGQMAYRILYGKTQERAMKGRDSSFIILNSQGLNIVEKGKSGMRNWTAVEKELIIDSQYAREKREHRRKQVRTIFISGVIAISILAVLSTIFWQRTENNRRKAESNALASQALYNIDTNPTKSFKMAKEALNLNPGNDLAFSALLQSRYSQTYSYNEEVYAVPFYENILAAKDWVYMAEYSSDGNNIIAGVRGGIVYLLDSIGRSIDTISLLDKKGVKRGIVRAVHFSKDNNFFLVAIDRSLFLFGPDRNIFRHRLLPGDIRSAEFSSNGQQIIYSYLNTAEIWNWNDKSIIFSIKESKGILDAKFSPDGNYIATVSEDELIRLYSAQGEFIDSLLGHDDQINSIAFNENYDSRNMQAPWLASGGSGETTIVVWSFLGKTYQRLIGHESEVFSVQFSNNGQYLISASKDETLKLWNIAAAKELLTLNGHQSDVYGVSFSPDDRYLLSASLDGTLKKWDLESQKILQISKHLERINSIDVSKYGNYIAATSDDKIVELWNKSKKTNDTLIFENKLTNAFFRNNEKELIVVDKKGTIYLCGFIEKQKRIVYKNNKGSVNSNVCLSKDGDLLGIAKGKMIQILDLNKGKIIDTLTGHNSNILSISFSDLTDKIIATYWDKKALIYDLKTKASPIVYELEGPGTDALFIPNEKGFIAANSSGNTEIIIYSIKHNSRIGIDKHDGEVRDLCISSDGLYIASAFYDGSIGLFNNNGGFVTFIQHPEKIKAIMVKFSIDNQYLVSGYKNGEILFWPINNYF